MKYRIERNINDRYYSVYIETTRIGSRLTKMGARKLLRDFKKNGEKEIIERGEI